MVIQKSSGWNWKWYNSVDKKERNWKANGLIKGLYVNINLNVINSVMYFHVQREKYLAI